MESTMRGYIEHALDELLKTESLLELKETIDSYEPAIKSKEDALFGFVLGCIRDTLAPYTLGVYRRLPTPLENQEITKMTPRRASEIKARILETLNLRP